MSVPFIRPGYFIWIFIPAGLWLAYTIFGMPHMIWSYSWRDDGQGYDPHATRYYTRCTYIGSYGPITIWPHDGKCPFLRFKKTPRSD